jgi:dynein heavy chain 2
MNDFSCKVLSLENLAPSTLNLKKIFEETTSSEPILFITTPGADPSTEIRELASKEVGQACYHEVFSM